MKGDQGKGGPNLFAHPRRRRVFENRPPMDYQEQLKALAQQNRKRLLMARAEDDAADTAAAAQTPA